MVTDGGKNVNNGHRFDRKWKNNNSQCNYSLVNPDYKIFSVEDVAEINIKHENWFSLVSRVGFGNDGEGEIGLYDLIKSGVRHRPDYIVVGEIRGSEAYVMFQAMATGHGGLCTMHADSLESASKRLQQKTNGYSSIIYGSDELCHRY